MRPNDEGEFSTNNACRSAALKTADAIFAVPAVTLTAGAQPTRRAAN
eukprot:CAMPEP_0203877892 /NCGR_PEP_ID=MMETSP0359-20131031/22462_1 /ASSEMBLY_ACC=CAM_ASM_000338 /TAXON_ID=268821 /ORGANISM="Scrippsiella Hangoei, Strain SHTV-5" /LENGTH=46 /DNA_ID= /DNA_START= /DNA_END= /DNA_ORIENTATION=